MTRTIATPKNATARHNSRCASQLARALTGGQPTHVVMSPGSRSTPLILAFDALPEVTLHVVLDERAAAFVALGVARSSGSPAIAVCTSGSAGAHYGPACVEASYGRVPLIVVTANRPPELQHCGAPQTIAQDRLLPEPLRFRAQLPVASESVRDTWLAALGARARRAASVGVAGAAGPVHLDVPFREPLYHPDHPPSDNPSTVAAGALPAAVAIGAERARALVLGPLASGRGVIVCGPHIGPLDSRIGAAARRLAAALRWPILAEAASGVRFVTPPATHQPAAVSGRAHASEANLIRCADILLRSPRFAAGATPEVVLLVGQTPTSKPLRTWLSTMPGRGIGIDPDGQLSDPTGCAARTLAGCPRRTLERLADAADGSCRVADAAWNARWRQAQQHIIPIVEQHTAEGCWEGRVAHELTRHAAPGSQLFVASSMPIRDVDSFGSQQHANLHVIANRGCNGIDGAVATAAGLALASRRPTLAWLGDLTLLHDLDGLEAAGNAGWPLTLVVVNNRGGGIFHQLPIAHHRGVFERLFATPRSARLAPLCEALGAHHQQVALAAGAFPEALRNAQQRPGLKLLEISVDRHHSVRRRRAALHACEQALHDWLSRRRQTPAAATDAALNREAAS